MEKVIRRHLFDFWRQNSILSDKHYGFLPGRSTTLQLLKAFDDWTAELDKGFEVDRVYIDFKKVFDSVLRKKLLNTKSKYGIKGKILNWITAFLTDRRPRIVVNESFLDWAPLVSGVPQRSVRGPILFLIYINSMTDGITSPMLLYADDAKIFRSITDETQEEKLHLDLNEISKKAKSSLMMFNLTKCHTLTLTGRTKQSERNYTLNGGKQLSKIQSEKDLGAIVDSRLQYSEHIAKKTKVANSIVAIIRKNFLNLTSEILTTLYKALVRTHLEYANQAWNPYLKKTKLIPGIRKYSYSKRRQILKLPTLEYRRKRGRMIEVFKFLNGLYDTAAIERFFLQSTKETQEETLSRL